MLGPRGRSRKILFVMLGCGLSLVILKYITHINRKFSKLNFAYGIWTDRRRYITTTTTTVAATSTRHQPKCNARTLNTATFLNLTKLLAKLNHSTGEIPNLKSGGRYTPKSCKARHRVAVIVPYRDRENQLQIFVEYMHPFLQKQQLDYGIFVIEPISGEKFNRGLLLNIGFVEVNKLHDYDCFIFHDVDLLPESDFTNYTCDQSPLHMSSAIDAKKYRIPYPSYFGGVCGIKRDHFETINGFSNLYFDWGGEDDDIQGRISNSHMRITRLSPENGRYIMLRQVQARQNPDKILLLKTIKLRQRQDGLNSLIYHVIQQESKRLYTWILVKYNETLILENETIHRQAFIPKLLNVSRSYTLGKNISLRRNSIHFFQNRDHRNHSIFNKNKYI